jgi:hypothetical protein
MIEAVTGAPGAGKSASVVDGIAETLATGRFVATNVTLRPGWEYVLARQSITRRLIRGRVEQRAEQYRARLFYTPDLTTLMRVKPGCTRCYAAMDPLDANHCMNGHFLTEGRCVAVVDEAHKWLNNRAWNDDVDRSSVVRWFKQHRKLGFDIRLVDQSKDAIDKQVRDLIEYHTTIRNMRRAKLAGVSICPFNLFLKITVWDQGPQTRKHVTGRKFSLLNKTTRALYNSWAVNNSDDLYFGEPIYLPQATEGLGLVVAPRVEDEVEREAPADPPPAETVPG